LRKQLSSTPYIGNAFVTVGYTYAHSIDTASGFREFNSSVPTLGANIFRSSSDFDVRHFISLSGGWELPINRGPKALVKGWNLYPILTWRTGYPLTAFAGGLTENSDPGPSGAGDAGLANADQIAPVQYLNPHHIQSLGGSPLGPFLRSKFVQRHPYAAVWHRGPQQPAGARTHKPGSLTLKDHARLQGAGNP